MKDRAEYPSAMGCKNKASRAMLETVKSMGSTATQKLFEAVDRGEKWAIELVLSKVLPTSRTIEMESLSPLDILAALTAGDISPEEGKALSNTVKNLQELEKIEIIEARVTELESAVVKDDA